MPEYDEAVCMCNGQCSNEKLRVYYQKEIKLDGHELYSLYENGK